MVFFFFLITLFMYVKLHNLYFYFRISNNTQRKYIDTISNNVKNTPPEKH